MEERLSNTMADITPAYLARLGLVRVAQPKPPKLEKVIQPKPVAVKLPKEPKQRKKLTGSQGRTPLPDTVLRRSQLRALAAFAQAEATSGSAAISLSEIAKGARISEQSVKQGLGNNDPMRREKHDSVVGYRSLLTRGLVVAVEVGGEYRYYLSSLGMRRIGDLDDVLKEIKETPPITGGVDKRTGPKAPKPKDEKKPVKRQQKKRTKENVEKVSEEVSQSTL